MNLKNSVRFRVEPEKRDRLGKNIKNRVRVRVEPKNRFRPRDKAKK
jgi:hypothetical protein